MADLVDHDTLAAVKAYWIADPTLPTLVDRPPQSGRLEAGQPSVYAALACSLERRELTGTLRTWHDHRRVTITVYGPEKPVRQAIARVLGRFNLATTLAYPSGARFLRWWADDGNRLEQDEQRRQGEDIWKGIVTGLIWSIRSR